MTLDYIQVLEYMVIMIMRRRITIMTVMAMMIIYDHDDNDDLYLGR